MGHTEILQQVTFLVCCGYFLANTDGLSSVKFDGVDDYVSISDKDSLDVGIEDYMYSFWLKLDETDRIQRIINKGVEQLYYDVNIAVDNKLNVEVCDGTFPARMVLVISKKLYGELDLADLDFEALASCYSYNGQRQFWLYFL